MCGPQRGLALTMAGDFQKTLAADGEVAACAAQK